MEFLTTFGIMLLVALVIGVLMALAKASEETDIRKSMTPEEREERGESRVWGVLRSEMICPHCQVKGQVRTKSIQRKKGISGGKATAAVLTGGTSMLATGLSRKEKVTQAHCSNCSCTWDF